MHSFSWMCRVFCTHYINTFMILIQGVHKVRVHFVCIFILKCTRTLWTPCIFMILLWHCCKSMFRFCVHGFEFYRRHFFCRPEADSACKVKRCLVSVLVWMNFLSVDLSHKSRFVRGAFRFAFRDNLIREIKAASICYNSLGQIVLGI